MSRKPVTVTIAGSRYTVRGSDEDHLQRVAAFLDRRIDEARQVAKAASPQQLVVLAALNIAEELFAAEARLRAVTEETKSKLSRVITKIEPVLEPRR